MKNLLPVFVTILIILISFSESRPAIEKLMIDAEIERPYFMDLFEKDHKDSTERTVLDILKQNFEHAKRDGFGHKDDMAVDPDSSSSSSSSSSQSKSKEIPPPLFIL